MVWWYNATGTQTGVEQPVIVTLAGKPYATLVPLEGITSSSEVSSEMALLKKVLAIVFSNLPPAEIEDRLENEVLDGQPELIRVLEHSRKHALAEGGLTIEEMRRELGLTG